MRNRQLIRIVSALSAAAIAVSSPMAAFAKGDTGSVLNVLPSAGVGYHFSAEQVSLSSIKQEVASTPGSGSATVSAAVSANGVRAAAACLPESAS